MWYSKASSPVFRLSQLVARIHDIRGLAFILAWIYDLGIMEALCWARSGRDCPQGSQRSASFPGCIKLFRSAFGWVVLERQSKGKVQLEWTSLEEGTQLWQGQLSQLITSLQVSFLYLEYGTQLG